MRRCGSIASSADKFFILTIRDVEVCLRIPVFLRQPEIYYDHLGSPLPNTHQKVVRFEVPMNE